MDGMQLGLAYNQIETDDPEQLKHLNALGKLLQTYFCISTASVCIGFETMGRLIFETLTVGN